MITKLMRDRLDAPSPARTVVRPQAPAVLADPAMFGSTTGASTGEHGPKLTARQAYLNVMVQPSAALHERSP